MSRWAFWMFVVSGAGVVVTAVGVWFVRETLRETQAGATAAHLTARHASDALKESQRSNKIALDTREMQLRAYVSIERAEIVYVGDHATLDVYLVNSGSTPARQVRMHFDILAHDLKLEPPPIRPAEQVNPLERFDLAPGGRNRARSVCLPEVVSREIKRLSSEADAALKIYGAIYYDDFSGKGRETAFCFLAAYTSQKLSTGTLVWSFKGNWSN